MSLSAVDYLLDFDPTAMPKDDDKIGESYTLVRVGGIRPRGDVSGFDDGFWGEVAFGNRVMKILSFEVSAGYFNIDGGPGGAEVYGIPVKLDARLGLPVLIFEVYGGVGLGGLWAHTSASGASSEDSLAWLWDAFVGAEVGLGGVAVGIEYRYLKTDDLDAPGGGNYQLEGNMLFITGRLPF